MSCESGHCITCGDEGVPMRVWRLEPAAGLALCVDVDGEAATVDVTLVEPVAPGAEILVHAGVAIASLEAAA